MRLLLAAVLSATFVLSGCASSSSPSGDEGKPAPVDESDSASLREATNIEGSTAVGAPITIQYVRKPEYKRVPYLAVEVLPEPSAKATDLRDFKVTGAFPGSPKIIVVDEQFTVLTTSTVSAVQPDGAWQSVTTLSEPRQGKLLVIVHDALWSKPMSFEVHASIVPAK